MPACNAAAERARGDVLITLDADVIPAPGFCDAIRRPAVEGRGWAGWMGLVTMDDGPPHQHERRRLALHRAVLDRPAGRAGRGRRDEPREVAFLSGACLAMTREAWERDPGFAPEYFLYFDDVDWCFRARLRGGRLGVEPRARVDHLYDFAKRRVKWRLLERNRWATVIRTYPRELLLRRASRPARHRARAAADRRSAGGWLREKLAADLDVVRWLPRLLRERRAIQRRRRISAAEFADHLTADLDSPLLRPRRAALGAARGAARLLGAGAPAARADAALAAP